MSAGDRDWANLPPELLGSIVERLTVTDYIRFGAVCTSWASTASAKDWLPLAPEMPWLLLFGDEAERGESCTLVSIHDRHRRRRMAPAPELRGKWCLGSQDGWIALLDESSEVSLLNLLTRAQIHLPSVTTIPDVNPVYNSDGSVSEYYYNLDTRRPPLAYTLPEFRPISFKKVVLSSKPTAGTYAAMAIFSGFNALAIAKAGEEEWTLLRAGPWVTDIIYSGGKFLAVSSEGDLLLVWRMAEYFKTYAVRVMKFDRDHAAWVPLKSLGNNSLFLGLCYSISLSAWELSELKPNCIYYTEVLFDWLSEDADEDKLMMRDVWVFNLEDESFDRYYPPDPRLNWPPPLWFAPSLL